MTRQTLHVTIRTPSETVVDQDVASLRVPTQTGQVGLRPRGEPSVLAVEAGLIVLRLNGGDALCRHRGRPAAHKWRIGKPADAVGGCWATMSNRFHGNWTRCSPRRVKRWRSAAPWDVWKHASCRNCVKETAPTGSMSEKS